jgi:predicted house-cleaning noncanonical NTP pyrophosphatase (MazG superfamily)
MEPGAEIVSGASKGIRAEKRPDMGKLVRDKIPAIIRERGGDPVVTVLGEVDYRRALLEKLFEESTELSEASATEVAEEIADVLEVLRAIARVHGHEWRDIEKVAEVKRAERGAFLERIYLG